MVTLQRYPRLHARLEAPFKQIEQWAWVLGVLFWGVGDMVTTSISMHYGFGYESTQIVAEIMLAYGFPGRLAFKISVFLVGAALFRVLPRPYRLAIPVGFVLGGLHLTIGNIGVILAGL